MGFLLTQMLTGSLYKGMEATFWRHWWWSGGYFGSIFFVKDLLPKPEVRISR
jgi:solute carrier family 25 2-oxodicarboxylate transporter 21